MGTGGMRYGAGRPVHKDKAEGLMRLDVRQWKKRAALWPGASGSWSWSNTSSGETIGSIGYSTEGTTLVLSYSLSGEPKTQRVPILRSACTYGGSRPWLGCPHCGARVGVLYMRRGGFYCRKCARVAHRSQSEDSIVRAWRVQQKAEAKLGDNWARSKGMHSSTYEKMLEVIDRCEEVRYTEIALFMLRHAKPLGPYR